MPMQRPWWDALVDDNGTNTVGTVWNKAQIKAMTDGLDPALHGGSVSRSGSVTVLHDSELFFSSWNVIDWAQPANIWQAPDRFVIGPGEGGLYLVTLAIRWGSHATGYRRARIFDNSLGIEIIRDTTQGVAGAEGPTNTMTLLWNAPAGGQFIVALYQNSGAALDMVGGRFQCVRI
jgi:hypothetical protein